MKLSKAVVWKAFGPMRRDGKNGKMFFKKLRVRAHGVPQVGSFEAMFVQEHSGLHSVTISAYLLACAQWMLAISAVLLQNHV